MVKDNGYGFGAVAVANVALVAGRLLVSNLDEAAELRDAEVGTDPADGRTDGQSCRLVEPHVGCWRTGRGRGGEPAGGVAGLALAVHVKIDTGMGRYGVRWSGRLAC